MDLYGGFDHNIQTLRIVTTLDNKYYKFKGLNLTLETLDGLVKHNGPVNDKIKYDNILGKNIFKNKINFNSSPSVESQISSISYYIAYNSHDLEDGLKAFAVGDYFFANEVDLGRDFNVSVERILTTVSHITNSNITQLITGPPDGVTWKNYAKDGNFSGPSADFVNCKILVQTKQNSDSSFNTAVPFASGIFTTRFLKFSLELSSTDPNQNIRILQAGYKLLFDTGRNVATRLMQANVPPASVTHVFFTHFHSDHTVGFADFWLSSWLPAGGSRSTPLNVLGLSLIHI